MTFGPLPEPRPIPEFVRPQRAEDLALQVIRQRSAQQAAAQGELAEARKQADALAEKLALQVFKRRAVPKDPLVQSLQQLLRMEGITLHTYAGEEVTEDLETDTDIVEWLPAGDDPIARVADALEPEIRRQGRLIHRAKLSCRMAAEPVAPPVAPEAAPAAPEEAASEAAPAAPEEAAPEAAPAAPEEAAPEAVPAATEEAAPEAPAAPQAPAELPNPSPQAWKDAVKKFRKEAKKAAQKAEKQAKAFMKKMKKNKKGS